MNAIRCITIAALAFILLSKPALANDIEIGVMLPLTGVGAEYGARVKQGIDKVSVPGVRFVYEDDQCRAVTAVSAYRRLKDVGKVKYFLGPCCGASAKAVAPLYKHGEQLGISICGLSDALLDQAGGNFYYTQYSVEDEAKFLADHLFSIGKRKVAVLFLEHEFSRMQESAFKRYFKGETESFPFNEMDVSSMRPVLLKIKGGEFDAVLTPLVQPLMLGLMKELKRVGLGSLPVFSVYAAQVPEVLEINGEDANGLVYSHPAIDIDQDATIYFPHRGAQILAESVAACKGEYKCVREKLRSQYNFDDRGVLPGKIELRTIKNGRFSRVASP